MTLPIQGISFPIDIIVRGLDKARSDIASVQASADRAGGMNFNTPTGRGGGKSTSSTVSPNMWDLQGGSGAMSQRSLNVEGPNPTYAQANMRATLLGNATAGRLAEQASIYQAAKERHETFVRTGMNPGDVFTSRYGIKPGASGREGDGYVSAGDRVPLEANGASYAGTGYGKGGKRPGETIDPVSEMMTNMASQRIAGGGSPTGRNQSGVRTGMNPGDVFTSRYGIKPGASGREGDGYVSAGDRVPLEANGASYAGTGYGKGGKRPGETIDPVSEMMTNMASQRIAGGGSPTGRNQSGVRTGMNPGDVFTSRYGIKPGASGREGDGYVSAGDRVPLEANGASYAGTGYGKGGKRPGETIDPVSEMMTNMAAQRIAGGGSPTGHNQSGSYESQDIGGLRSSILDGNKGEMSGDKDAGKAAPWYQKKMQVRNLLRYTLGGIVTDIFALELGNEANYKKAITLAGMDQHAQAGAELGRFTGGLRAVPILGPALTGLASPLTSQIETQLELSQRQNTTTDLTFGHSMESAMLGQRTVSMRQGSGSYEQRLGGIRTRRQEAMTTQMAKQHEEEKAVDAGHSLTP